MRIGKTEVVLTGQSNFVVAVAVDSNASQRDVAAITRAASVDIRTNLFVLKNYFCKVFGLNRQYPTIFGPLNRQVVEVRQPTLEIWAGRALVAYGVYSMLGKLGIL